MRIQYGDRCMSRTQVYEWTQKFKNGVTSVEDSPRPGPTFTAVTEDNIAAVENVIRENRRVTVKEVASLLDISVGSAHHIIHNEMKFRTCVQDGYPSDCHLKWKRDVSMLAKSFRVGMRLMAKHFCSVSSLGWELGTLLRARTICRQSRVDFLLGLQRADLRALYAHRKHCDQRHLLKLYEGKSEASYSPETARILDDGSVSPSRQCEATYCYSNSVDYWWAAVWVHPTPTVLTLPRAVGFSRLRSIEGCAEWNAVPRRRWGSVGGAWVAAHSYERTLFLRNLRACQALV